MTGEAKLSDTLTGDCKLHGRSRAACDHSQPIMTIKRQFCRTGIHDCIPAVTLTFGGGAGRLHWCAEHAADAEPYRVSADGQLDEPDFGAYLRPEESLSSPSRRARSGRT